MTERSDGPSAPVSDEGRKHLEDERLLAGVDWHHRATVHADAFIETRNQSEFVALLGAAAFAVRQIEARRQVNKLKRQLEL